MREVKSHRNKIIITLFVRCSADSARLIPQDSPAVFLVLLTALATTCPPRLLFLGTFRGPIPAAITSALLIAALLVAPPQVVAVARHPVE